MTSANPSQENLTPVRIGRELGAAFGRVEQLIRDRAYQIFLGRDGEEGDPVADWFAAQLEVVEPLDIVLKDQKKNVVVEAKLEGFSPKEIEIEVGTDELKIFGSHSESKSTEKKGATRSSSETRYFYQVVSLPCAVDRDACKAKLFKNGKLRITLPKVSPAQ